MDNFAQGWKNGTFGGLRYLVAEKAHAGLTCDCGRAFQTLAETYLLLLDGSIHRSAKIEC